jgi:hypothetical protein
VTSTKATTVNTADGSASVGVQADTVHGGVHFYQVSDSDTAEHKFAVGVRYLRAGVASEARKLIGRAVFDGFENNESYFYLTLATVSGRTLQHLSSEDLDVLRRARRWVVDQPEDGWTRALRVINRLLESLPTVGDGDMDVIVKEFDCLGDEQREEVLRNLEVFLAGPHQDWTWERAFEAARRERCADDRLNRVWKFFQPRPAGPRVLWPQPVRVPTLVWVRTIAVTVVAVVPAFLLVGWAWRHSWPTAAGALLVVMGAGYLCGRSGVRRRHLRQRLRRKERQFSPGNTRKAAAGRHRFAAAVDKQFRDYFRRYVPDGMNREDWFTLTAGIRQTLRDEVVEAYRERSIDAKRVAWLTRFLASEVKRKWQNDTLLSYRHELRVPLVTQAAFFLSSGAAVAAACSLLWAALQQSPFAATAAAVVALMLGVPTVRGWVRLALDYKRFAADYSEAQQRFAERDAAYERWLRKLRSRPDDDEMARWLDCDHKALVEEAMRHYKLAPHDVIAHAFIEAPAASSKRARVPKGPWRYSRYRLMIFLLTVDGVRQMTVNLDFEKARFADRERSNYRYDAVAAVHVIDADSVKTLELTLVNSHSIKTPITGAPPQSLEPGEDPRTITQVSLDAAGLYNTLHVLEGIAAEGKEWITYERERERDGLAKLVHATAG